MLPLDKLKQAVKILNQGGVIVYPTDTAFGIGCRIDDERAINRLFSIRRRPIDLPVPVLIDSTRMAEEYLLSPLPENMRHLMERYWPGALTIVYYCQLKKVFPLVRANSKTLGIRNPNHKIALSLIKGTGVPLLGPSANFHGLKTPYKYQDLDESLLKLVDFVIPGSCVLGNVSTVVDCTVRPYQIIRQGAMILYNQDII